MVTGGGSSELSYRTRARERLLGRSCGGTGGGPWTATLGIMGSGSGSVPLGSGDSRRGMPSMVFCDVLRAERADASEAGGGGGGSEAGGSLGRKVAGGIPSTVCFRIRGDDGRVSRSLSFVGAGSS
ncbi:MAG: hypothetical protein OEM15_04045 [Myxococcales bacterium]|nr:hypothetical protein [Myxococcales bacterium]MDH3483883.1 hypothetical protein [Myxococcales bacterium]